MELKSLQLIHFRKFNNENNTINFATKSKKNCIKNCIKEESDKNTLDNQRVIDFGNDSTLIVGRNNAGKSTIIKALDMLINYPNTFGINDFNFKYLKEYFEKSKPQEITSGPYIKFILTVTIEKNSTDLLQNLLDFIYMNKINEQGANSSTEVVIKVMYEVKEFTVFKEGLKELLNNEKTSEEQKIEEYMQLLRNTEFILNFYTEQDVKVTQNFKLSNLIELKCIKANNIQSEHCLSDCFNNIMKYRYNQLTIGDKNSIDSKIYKWNQDISKKIRSNHTADLKNILGQIVSNNNIGINLSGDITVDKLMQHLIKYEYEDDEANIPEDQFGLGYTNLILMIATIIEYIEKYPDDAFSSRINILAIEEPETYMHPQMQHLFIENINNALKVLLKTKNKEVNCQVLITSHSSQILNSKIQSNNTFDNIAYLYHNAKGTNIVNLSNSCIISSTLHEDIKNFMFLKKHIKYKAADLFFAEAVILVEGYAEDIILPYYIENDSRLSKHHISVFSIGGAHGHVYQKLITTLGIPTVVVTDLDIKRSDGDTSQISSLDARVTTNNTIKKLVLGGKSDLSNIPTSYKEGNLYVAYQQKVEGYYPTSFEEAMILTNYNSGPLQDQLGSLLATTYQTIQQKYADEKYSNVTKGDYILKENSYLWQKALSTKKGIFATELLYELLSNKKKEIFTLPNYIEDALRWIKEKIKDGI